MKQMRRQHLGPYDSAPKEIQDAWDEALREARASYPPGDPHVLDWAEAEGVSEEHILRIIAHEYWLKARASIVEQYIQEETEREAECDE